MSGKGIGGEGGGKGVGRSEGIEERDGGMARERYNGGGGGSG